MMVDQKKLYKVLFQEIGEGLLVCGERGLIEVVNTRTLELFGYEKEEELIGQSIDILVPKRFHEHHGTYHSNYMKDPTSRPMGQGKTLFGSKKDGSEFPVEISLSAFEEAEGKKVVAMISDITLRKKMQDDLYELNQQLENLVEARSKELAKSNLLYKSIARNFPKGSIYVFNKDLEYIFADGQELVRRNISGDDLVGVNFREMMDKSIHEAVIPMFEKVFNGEEHTTEIEYRSSVFSLHGVPLKVNGSPEVDRILVVERDITQEKEVESEIKRSLERERELNNLKSRFVTIVSHEFRTPLSAIKSSAELIERYPETAQNDKRLKHTERIQNSVNHLNGMIEDILSLSKIEEGAIELKKETFYLDHVLKEVIDQNLEVYPNQRYEFEVDHHEIESDPKLIKHVVGNLISNAFKYTADEKLITVVVAEEEDYLRLRVKDQGIGIPISEQEKLFERFYRATNAQNIKGTGLGLNIAIKYLDYLGGEITFESAENKGSEFIVRFPKRLN